MARAPESRTGPGAISVGAKMTFLLLLAVAAVTAGFFVVQRSLSGQLDVLMREHVTETSRILTRVLELRASGASVHADDYTRWDDFVSFARRPDPQWAQVNLTESIATFGLDAAWVLDDQYRLIYTANPKQRPAFASPPVSLPVLSKALAASPIRHFFAETGEGLLEVWTSSIQPSDDFTRKQPSAGTYIVGRLWTGERIRDLANLLDGTVSLAVDPAGPTGALGSSENGQVTVRLPIEDVNGTQLGVLCYTSTYPAAPRVRAAIRIFLMLLTGGALLLFVCVSFALSHWVAQPLARITASLRNENPSLLSGSMERHDEIGHLARLVRDFFIQKRHLVEAREATESAAQAKQQFLANISHELRTPMHGIISYARFGVEDAPKALREDLLDYFQQIASCGESLLALLDDLLDLAKFDSGRMTVELAELRLDEVAGQVADEFTTLYRERRLVLDRVIEAGLPAVRGDRSRLRQVFRNLLSNAAKFTPAGGRVGMHVVRRDSVARVMVEDQGKGIPAGELEVVFDRFSQASNNRAGAGTGLGLPLCREIVTLHGGRIWAENGAPAGARVIFEIPLAAASMRGPEAEAA